jgi:hypothetical protein
VVTVDTIVRPPDSISKSVATEDRRRWRWVSLAVVLVLFGATVLVVSIWVANYDPFTRGSRLWPAQDERIRITDVDAIGASGTLFEFRAAGPASFVYTFSISNAGPVAVTIQGVGPPVEEQMGELSRRPVRVVEDEMLLRDDGELIYERWHPFVLRPGQEADIEMEVELDPTLCLNRGTSLSWWPETITFSVFGLPRETTFESNLEVRVIGTRDCPES